MIKDGTRISIVWNIICVCIGCLLYGFWDGSTTGHYFFVGMVTLCLIFTVLYNYERIIRPMSYFILSFFVFVWMRILLNAFFDTVVISIGNGINDINIHHTTLFLGITMCGMVVIALVAAEMMNRSTKDYLLIQEKIYINSYVSMVIVMLAVILFIAFLIDSVNKISVIQAHDYLSVSENIMLEGYNYFRFGKYLLILWVLLGKNEKRIFISSTILLVASFGYLMRGARGYTMCYFFLWLLLFAKEHKVKFVNLVIVGLGLIILANWIAEYRLGYSLANGLGDIIIKTLHSQGASIEPVFGAVNFKKEILEIFPQNELLFRDDFGLYIDDARGVNFVSGGFGTSFFAELFFMGIPGSIFALLMAVSVGLMEHAYDMTVQNKDKSSYYELIIFLTCSNLIYFARANIKNFVVRMVMACIIVAIVGFFAKGGIGNLARKKAVKKRIEVIS